MKKRVYKTSSRGIALVTALIVVLVVFMLIMSALYMVTSSTTMSGAGKRYATVQEAADGAVEVMKEAINLITATDSITGLQLTETSGPGLVTSILNDPPAAPTTVTLTLPGTELATRYQATVTVERLFTKNLPGGRIEFGRSASGAGTTALYFRINATVAGKQDNTRAETSALYRLSS